MNFEAMVMLYAAFVIGELAALVLLAWVMVHGGIHRESLAVGSVFGFILLPFLSTAAVWGLFLRR